jgi:hypothetical protein
MNSGVLDYVMVYRLPFVSLAWKWIIISMRNFLLLANNFQPLIRSDGGVSGKSTAVITASGSSERFIFLPFLSCVTIINQINFAYLYITLAHWIGSNQNLLVCALALFFFQISMVVASFFFKNTGQLFSNICSVMLFI